jgi:hypothetical protein
MHVNSSGHSALAVTPAVEAKLLFVNAGETGDHEILIRLDYRGAGNSGLRLVHDEPLLKEPTMNQSSKHNNFDAVVVAEIQILRSGEQRLERLYSDLQTKPQLRDHFLRELAELQLRADRLDAVLSPVAAYNSSSAA